jgi:probable F420-dependent oxidoreductase
MPTRPFRFALQSFSASSAKEWRDRARKVEDLGFSALHLADHVAGPGSVLEETNHPVQSLAAVPAIAAAAAATTTLRVGCRVFCIDYHHPAVLAKEAATLDLLSDGRLELGLGAGWLQKEYEAIGLQFDPPKVRIDRLAEVVSFIKAHMAGEQLVVSGDHVNVTGYAGLPLPVQRPHPPIMIGGGGKRVLRLAAREADIVSLNFNNRSGVIGVEGVMSSTADLTSEKIGWIREAAGDRFDQLEIEIGAYFTFVGDNTDPIATGMAEGFGMSVEDLKRHPHALFGSVDEVVAELQRRRETYGISYVTVSERALDDFAPVVAKLAGT